MSIHRRFCSVWYMEDVSLHSLLLFSILIKENNVIACLAYSLPLLMQHIRGREDNIRESFPLFVRINWSSSRFNGDWMSVWETRPGPKKKERETKCLPCWLRKRIKILSPFFPRLCSSWATLTFPFSSTVVYGCDIAWGLGKGGIHE